MIETIRQHMANGQYVLAAALGRGLSMLEGEAPGIRAEAAYLAAECQHRVREFAGAAQMARRGLDLALESGDLDVQGRCWYRLSGALTAYGDSRAAVDAGREFLRGLESGDWPQLVGLRGRCLTNIGMALRDLRKPADAMEALTHSLMALVAQNDAPGVVKVRHILAWMLTEQDRLEEADEHLTAAQGLIPEVTEFAQHQMAGLAFLRLKQGVELEADLLVTELLSPHRQDVTPANQAIAYYVRGMLFVAHGHTDAARACLQAGQELALRSDVPAMMNLLTQLRRRLFEAQAQP